MKSEGEGEQEGEKGDEKGDEEENNKHMYKDKSHIVDFKKGSLRSKD